MKSFTIIVFFAFFASNSFAQTQVQQQLPPSIQTDTTSGWQLVFSNPRYFITNLKYFPEGIVYATAYNGVSLLLMRSYDLGLTWDTLSRVIQGSPVLFISPQVGFADGTDAAKLIWKTTDGGNNWKSYPKNSITSGEFIFASQDTGVMLGVGEMVRTTDAGITWKATPALNDINKVDGGFANSQVGYAIGGKTAYPPKPTADDAAYCQKTTDAGAMWFQVYTGLNADMECISIIDSNTLFIAGTNYLTARTTDGGTTWDSVKISQSNTGLFQTISFINKKHGFVAGGGWDWQFLWNPLRNQ